MHYPPNFLNYSQKFIKWILFFYVVDWIPIDTFDTRSRKTHRDKPWTNVRQIKIVAILSKAILRSGDDLSQEIHTHRQTHTSPQQANSVCDWINWKTCLNIFYSLWFFFLKEHTESTQKFKSNKIICFVFSFAWK